MERILVIGSSGGIGSALADAFERQGAEVLGLSRSANGFDITDESAIEKHLGHLEGPFDRIIVATGALEIAGAVPEKNLSQLSASALLAQYQLNAIGPALVLKYAHRLLPRDRPSVFAALSARVGSIGDNRMGGWYSYRAAKAALNQLIHSGSIELARTHPKAICVTLHPGTVATEFTRKYLGRHPAVEPQEAVANLIRVIDGLEPKDTGHFFDWAGKEVPW